MTQLKPPELVIFILPSLYRVMKNLHLFDQYHEKLNDKKSWKRGCFKNSAGQLLELNNRQLVTLRNAAASEKPTTYISHSWTFCISPTATTRTPSTSGLTARWTRETGSSGEAYSTSGTNDSFPFSDHSHILHTTTETTKDIRRHSTMDSWKARARSSWLKEMPTDIRTSTT